MKPDIDKIANMLTDDPDIFVENSGRTQPNLDMPTITDIDPEATRVDLIPQQSGKDDIHAQGAQLKEIVAAGGIPEGNVELAALLGHPVARVAMGHKGPYDPKSVRELAHELLIDPNIIITIDVREPTN